MASEDDAHLLYYFSRSISFSFIIHEKWRPQANTHFNREDETKSPFVPILCKRTHVAYSLAWISFSVQETSRENETRASTLKKCPMHQYAKNGSFLSEISARKVISSLSYVTDTF